MSCMDQFTSIFSLYIIVHFKSLRNCKRRNKGYFTLKTNSNKIVFFGSGGGTLSCFKFDFNVLT